MTTRPSRLPEIGPDGLARESPAIAYTEKMIEEEQVQLKKYIEQNYSKIRDVERELANLSMEMKLTAGPKKAALEHLRKKIEVSTEKIRVAKLKEDEAKKAWEAASKAVQDEEALKKKLCDDLSNLVQEGSNSQLSRLEELKRRLGALNPTRSSSVSAHDGSTAPVASSVPRAPEAAANGAAQVGANQGNEGTNNGKIQQPLSGEKKKVHFQGRGGRGIGAVPKGRNQGPGWTGSGFDVDSRTSQFVLTLLQENSV